NNKSMAVAVAEAANHTLETGAVRETQALWVARDYIKTALRDLDFNTIVPDVLDTLNAGVQVPATHTQRDALATAATSAAFMPVADGPDYPDLPAAALITSAQPGDYEFPGTGMPAASTLDYEPGMVDIATATAPVAVPETPASAQSVEQPATQPANGRGGQLRNVFRNTGAEEAAAQMAAVAAARATAPHTIHVGWFRSGRIHKASQRWGLTEQQELAQLPGHQRAVVEQAQHETEEFLLKAHPDAQITSVTTEVMRELPRGWRLLRFPTAHAHAARSVVQAIGADGTRYTTTGAEVRDHLPKERRRRKAA
ncbi:MAG: hypothetical protein KGL95_10885, partial [Patescibacteria group bacterium]|nr:hypothetical protein [Patescibacteria group bacterium]